VLQFLTLGFFLSLSLSSAGDLESDSDLVYSSLLVQLNSISVQICVLPPYPLLKWRFAKCSIILRVGSVLVDLVGVEMCFFLSTTHRLDIFTLTFCMHDLSTTTKLYSSTTLCCLLFLLFATSSQVAQPASCPLCI
jgi:hypothetical protein